MKSGNQDSLLVQIFFGAGGERDVGALHHQPGLEAVDVVFMDHVRAGGRNPDVAIEVDDAVPVQFLAFRVIGHAFAGLFQPDELSHVQAIRIIYRSLGV